MVKIFFRVWRLFPNWVHVLAAWFFRPKFLLAVAAIIFDEKGRILLFKHTYRKFEWGIPAGGLEYGEQPESAIARGLYEETGLKIKVQKLLFLDVSKEFNRHASLIYLCQIVSGKFHPSLEISEIQYFDVDRLPHMLFAEKDLIKRVKKIVQSETRRAK
jgi:8-oxo-dGTP diphosphatase